MGRHAKGGDGHGPCELPNTGTHVHTTKQNTTRRQHDTTSTVSLGPCDGMLYELPSNTVAPEAKKRRFPKDPILISMSTTG